MAKSDSLTTITRNYESELSPKEVAEKLKNAQITLSVVRDDNTNDITLSYSDPHYSINGFIRPWQDGQSLIDFFAILSDRRMRDWCARNFSVGIILLLIIGLIMSLPMVIMLSIHFDPNLLCGTLSITILCVYVPTILEVNKFINNRISDSQMHKEMSKKLDEIIAVIEN